MSPARLAVAWWLARVPGRDRLVLLAGLTVRMAAVGMLAYALPVSWAHLPRPAGSGLLAAILVAESLGVVVWWLLRHGLDPRSLWLDVPTGVAAALAGTALVGRDGSLGWVLFVYPYLLLLAFGAGLTCRRVDRALLVGATLGLANLAGLALFHPAPLAEELLIVPSYLVNPAVGGAVARLLRRGADEVAAARIAAVRESADLAAAAQRSRLATALHDRILQTLETLARGDAVADPGLRERVRARAAWLRRYVETGQADQSDDLSAALEAAARAARRVGITVEVNDARLRTVTEPARLLDPGQREALVEAAYQTIYAFSAGQRQVTLRATPEEDGVLVTVLSDGPGPPDPDEINAVRSRLGSVEGRLTVDASPYVELWVPRSR